MKLIAFISLCGYLSAQAPVNLRSAGAETGVAAQPLQVSLANTASNATPVTVGGTVSIGATTGQPALAVNSINVILPNNVVLPGQPPGLVQTTTGSTGSAGKTLSVSFSNTTSRGNTIIVACGGSNFATSNWTATVSDAGARDTWTQDIIINQSTTQFAAIFRAQNWSATVSSFLLTIAGSNSVNESLACTGYELLGAWQPQTALDQTNSGTNAGSTTPSAGSVTATTSNQMAIVSIAAGAASTPTLKAGANGWFLDSGSVAPGSGSLTFGAESMPLTTPLTAITGNATLTASNAWAAVIATYKMFTPTQYVTGIGVAGTAAGGVLTVQGAASMTKLLVTPDSVALPANQSVNVSQINGVTPLMGNGTTGTGSQRVTIASDNTAFSVNATLSAETTKVIGTARIIGNGGATLDSAPAATAPTNTLQVGGTFTTTPATLTTGQAGSLQLTAAQNLKSDLTTIAGNATLTGNGATGTGALRVSIANDSTGVVQPGNTANTTPWLVQAVPGTTNGLTTFVLEPAASDNHTNIKNGAGVVYHIVAFNNSATINYFRLYNAASGFNGCNSATNLLWEGHIPASTSDAGFVEDIGMGITFSTGISICVTGAYGQTNTTNATASAISLNIGYK